MELYIIRHGESEHNVYGYDRTLPFRGDPDLTALGRAQAQAAAQWLAAHAAPVHVLYTSTQARAQQTADAITAACHCRAIPDHRLRDFGANRADGSPYPNEMIPHRRQDVIIRTMPDIRISESEDGESYAQMKHRMFDWLNDVTASPDTQRPAAAVMHSGGLNALLDIILNVGNPRMCDVLPPPASISHFRYDPDTPYEPWRLYTIGSTEHLIGLK